MDLAYPVHSRDKSKFHWKLKAINYHDSLIYPSCSGKLSVNCECRRIVVVRAKTFDWRAWEQQNFTLCFTKDMTLRCAFDIYPQSALQYTMETIGCWLNHLPCGQPYSCEV